MHSFIHMILFTKGNKSVSIIVFVSKI